MRKIKILGLVFFTLFLFLPFNDVKAVDTCEKVADCKIGDVCVWENPERDISCGASSLHARCLYKTEVLGKKLYTCESVVGQACLVNDQCSGLSCVDKKCVDTATRTGSTGTVTATTSAAPTCNVKCDADGWFKGVGADCICCGICKPDDLLKVANNGLGWLFGIVGALGLAMFVYGGFLWVTSAGDSGQVSKGKDAMKNTVIGLVIMFSSGAIILALQSALKIDSSKQVTITGQTTSTSSSTSTSSATGAVTNGTKKLGEACSVLSGKSSQCIAGYYCKAIQTGGSVGVCIPKNIQSTLSSGDECYYMPNKDNPSLCKDGLCDTKKTNPVTGDKGTCSDSKALGSACSSNTDCEASSLFSVGSQCYNGACIPLNGRNVNEGGSCYVLPGSGTNDCASVYKCIPTELLATFTANTSRSAYIGKTGLCYSVADVSKGQDCSYNFQCSSPNVCRYNKCVPESFVQNVTENGECEYLDGIGSLDTCASGLECMEIDGVDKCGRP